MKAHITIRSVMVFGFLSVLTCPAPAIPSACPQTATSSESSAVDEMLNNAFRPDQPGAAAIVVRKNQVLLRKGYGMADLELKIPIEPDMVFRLGSVTKQFTATAILMLEERGKLAVTDPITKFLPDYPTHGHEITIEHLLTHTSGIRSYTSMPEWQALWRKDFKLDELIDFFKNQPMDFAPGERWLYDNSGYILLGAVVEKASGQSYEQFLRNNIFDPLGMKHSYYDHTEQIIPRRVKGYQRTAQGYENAPYLSMTQPYAAGSLASSVDDLATWNSAVWGNKLLKKETMAKAHRVYRLKDGRPTGYGYGWMIASYEGHRTVEHGGGIHGFATYVLSMPDDDIFVAILTNGSAGPDASPGMLAMKMAALAVGKPVVDPKPVALRPEQLQRCVGIYALEDKSEMTISVDADQLYMRRGAGLRSPLRPVSDLEFFVPNSLTRVVFQADAAGRITGLEVRPRVGTAETATRTDKTLPSRVEVPISAQVLEKYAGTYELAPNFNLVMTVEDGKLMTQATGQQKFQLYAESETKFFLKITDAQVEFIRDEAGNVTGLKLYQGGRITPGKRVKQ